MRVGSTRSDKAGRIASSVLVGRPTAIGSLAGIAPNRLIQYFRPAPKLKRDANVRHDSRAGRKVHMFALNSSLRRGDIPGMAVAVAALGHEYVELGLVLGLAQALEELPELALLLF